MDWREDHTIEYRYTTEDGLIDAVVELGTDGWQWRTWRWAALQSTAVVAKGEGDGLDSPESAMQAAAAWIAGSEADHA